MAIPIPAAAVDAVADILARVGPAGEVRGVRWVQQEGLHLTLRFLGATPPAALEPTAAAVRAAVEGHTSFRVALGGAGAFPSESRPRVLGLGIGEGFAALSRLAQDLDSGLVVAGWPATGRAYRPHLTVARTDAAPYDDGAAAARALITAVGDRSIAFDAERAVLYRSHLGRGPARYEVVAEAPLGTPTPA